MSAAELLPTELSLTPRDLVFNVDLLSDFDFARYTSMFSEFLDRTTSESGLNAIPRGTPVDEITQMMFLDPTYQATLVELFDLPTYLVDQV